MLAAAGLFWLLAAPPVRADILYSVRSGDTCAGIAARYGLSAAAVLAANPGLGGDPGKLQEGMVLVLPVEEGPLAYEEAETLQDPILLAGVEASPPPPTVLPIEGKPEEKPEIASIPLSELNRAGDRHRARQLAARRGRLLATARRFLGVPYRMGGTSARAFDCSGFTMRVFQMQGIPLPRTADVQYRMGVPVPPGQEQPGDLVFFETYLPGPSHVGIYVGNGRFIHASSSRGVTISSLADRYFRARYLGARRILD